MSLLQRARENKASALALYLVARDCLAQTGVEAAGEVAETCRVSGISRQQVYVERAHVESALAVAAVASPGRPRQGAVGAGPAESLAIYELRIAVLEFRLANPGAVVVHKSGRTTYNDAFKRFVLNAADSFDGRDDDFCRASGVPYTTLQTWRSLDAKEPIVPPPPSERHAVWPVGMIPNELARQVAFDFERWGGKVSDFLREEARRLSVSPRAIRSVLRIAGLLAVKAAKGPRYRGATVRASPGAIAVTDGKEISIELAASGDVVKVNWQGMVDQATACHLAVVVSEEEDAAAVLTAYEEAKAFLGRPALALVHDQKAVYWEPALKKAVEATTAMIPATLERPENKAVIEGEFGKWEREVGPLQLDDTSVQSLVKTAAREAIRAYTAGINHAARQELDGKSRVEAVRRECPDPAKDKALVEQLKAGHQRGRHKAAPLPTEPVARALLDDAFARLSLLGVDESGRLRGWLAATFEPDAIRRALAIFEAKRAKGSLRGKTAHRYLVKLIREAQIEIDLEREEHILLHYAETEKRSWLAELVAARDAARQEQANVEEHAIDFAERALFGGIFLEKAFWESEISALVAAKPALLTTVTTHIRRLYEAPPLCRRRLLSRLVTFHVGLERRIE